MRTLLRYLWPLRRLVVLSLLLAAATQVLTLIDPVIFGRIVDEYALNPDGKDEASLTRGAISWLLIAFAIATAARFSKAVQEYVLRLVVQKFGLEVFDQGLKHTLRLSYQEFEDQTSGSTVAMLQKVRTDTERFINGLVNILFSALVGMGFLVWYSVTRHWMLVPIFGIGILALGGFTGLLSQRIKATQRSIFRETARMAGAITESLRNIELIKSLGLALPETRRIRTFTRKIYELEMEKVRRVRSLTFFQGTAINLLKHSILFILLWLIFRKSLTPGELISMQFIVATIFVPLQDLGNIIVNYREAEASLQNFEELVRKPLETQPEVPVEIGLLDRVRFEDVVFRHRGAKEVAIDHVSFSAEVGDTIAFVGPSGSGKSTLVKLLVGLYRPNSGRVLFDDIPFDELRFNRIRRQFGFVTQDPQLFSGTIRENLLFVAPAATDAEMLEALARAAALPLVERSGQGLDTLVGEGGLRISGGERQRLSIARALLRKPRLFIFDEATSALDSITEQEISDSVRQISAQGADCDPDRPPAEYDCARRHDLRARKGEGCRVGRPRGPVGQRGLYYAMWRQQIGERDMRAIEPAAAQPRDEEPLIGAGEP